MFGPLTKSFSFTNLLLVMEKYSHYSFAFMLKDISTDICPRQEIIQLLCRRNKQHKPHMTHWYYVCRLNLLPTLTQFLGLRMSSTEYIWLQAFQPRHWSNDNFLFTSTCIRGSENGYVHYCPICSKSLKKSMYAKTQLWYFFQLDNL